MIDIQEYTIEYEGGSLWIGRMGSPGGQPVLMIHGAIENSRIFYSEKGKGLAPFLAQQGYDVFVTDLRGKGKSVPSADSGRSKGGQYEVITHDIPCILKKIQELKEKSVGVHMIAHSWGGVLVASYIARTGNNNFVKSVTFFACKRKIYVHHPRRWLMVDFMWTLVGSLATKMKGFLPAVKYGIGADNE